MGFTALCNWFVSYNRWYHKHYRNDRDFSRLMEGIRHQAAPQNPTTQHLPRLPANLSITSPQQSSWKCLHQASTPLTAHQAANKPIRVHRRARYNRRSGRSSWWLDTSIGQTRENVRINPTKGLQQSFRQDAAWPAGEKNDWPGMQLNRHRHRKIVPD